MDGLDSRGQVVVIGATNRPDAIDPALRRPGRFDRELLFSLPDATARAAILDINTSSWQPPLSREVKHWLVQNTCGYCGADLKALCSEAALVALRRAYPHVYDSSARLTLDPNRLVLGKGDFAAALNKVIPASRRGVTASPAKPLDSIVQVHTIPYIQQHIPPTYPTNSPYHPTPYQPYPTNLRSQLHLTPNNFPSQS